MVSVLPAISCAAHATDMLEVRQSCFCWRQLGSGLTHTPLLLPCSPFVLEEAEEPVSSIGMEMESHLDLATAVSTSAHNSASAWK